MLCGLVRYDLAWRGLEQYGVAWHSTVWFGAAASRWYLCRAAALQVSVWLCSVQCRRVLSGAAQCCAVPSPPSLTLTLTLTLALHPPAPLRSLTNVDTRRPAVALDRSTGGDNSSGSGSLECEGESKRGREAEGGMESEGGREPEGRMQREGWEAAVLFGVPGGSGGYAETILRFAAKELFGVTLGVGEGGRGGALNWKRVRGGDLMEYSVEVSGGEGKGERMKQNELCRGVQCWLTTGYCFGVGGGGVRGVG